MPWYLILGYAAIIVGSLLLIAKQFDYGMRYAMTVNAVPIHLAHRGVRRFYTVNAVLDAIVNLTDLGEFSTITVVDRWDTRSGLSIVRDTSTLHIHVEGNSFAHLGSEVRHFLYQNPAFRGSGIKSRENLKKD